MQKINPHKFYTTKPIKKQPPICVIKVPITFNTTPHINLTKNHDNIYKSFSHQKYENLNNPPSYEWPYIYFFSEASKK